VIAELKKVGCSTQVIPWKIGDGYITNDTPGLSNRILY
jgi:hypothetical protein